MRAFGFGAELAARRPPGRPTPPALSAPAGFALNGAANPALKAMLATARAGTGGGAIVMKGDSTTAGSGGAVNADGQSADVVTQLTGAAPYRPSAMLAAELTAAGWPAWDSGFVGDNGCQPNGVALAAYDPRVAFTGAAWTQGALQSLAGGGFLDGANSGGSFLQFTATCAAFEVVLYNTAGTIAVAVDGAAPTGVSATGGTVHDGNRIDTAGTNIGFTRITVPAGALGPHLLAVALISGEPLLGSVRGLRAAGIGILNHAACAAQSADQAAASVNGSQFSNQERLALDAPALTIVNLGLNDGAHSVAAGAYIANLQAIVTRARASGDVLLVSPHPANPSFSATATQLALRDAAAAFAASNGVAYLDLYGYFGSWAAVAARTADGVVHPNRSMYAEIGQVYRRCIQVMAA